MSKINIQDLSAEAEKLLSDIGERYGVLTKCFSDESFDLVTYGGAELHYKNAVEGCEDWRGYILDVIDDCPDAYEPEQIELLNQIHEQYVSYMLSKMDYKSLKLAEDSRETYVWFPGDINQEKIKAELAPFNKPTAGLSTMIYILNGKMEDCKGWKYALLKRTGEFKRPELTFYEENIESLNQSGVIVLIRHYDNQ